MHASSFMDINLVPVRRAKRKASEGIDDFGAIIYSWKRVAAAARRS